MSNQHSLLPLATSARIMKKTLQHIQFFIKMTLVAIWCAVTSIVFYLFSFPFNGRPWLSWAYAKTLNFGVRNALRISIKVTGRQNMIDGPAVIIMNHQSNFDPLLQGPVFPKNTVIIGKKELLKIPFWGRLFKATNNILVDRNKNPSTHQYGAGVEEATHRLKNHNCYVWIFPEGTRNHGNAMAKFKRGAFIIAIKAQVPIIPMISKPLRPILDVRSKRAPGGQHEITILPPISTNGMSLDDVPSLLANCEKLYRTNLVN